jgi:dihydrofolate reductase
MITGLKKKYYARKLLNSLVHIVAVDTEGVIGINDNLPWRCKQDLRMFKNATMGQIVVMGRRTWDSLPGTLPGRTTVVLTTGKGVSFKQQPDIIINSIEELLNLFNTYPKMSGKKVYIAGGAQLYKETLPFTKTLLVSYLPFNAIRMAHNYNTANRIVHYPIPMPIYKACATSKVMARLYTNKDIPFMVYLHTRSIAAKPNGSDIPLPCKLMNTGALVAL